MHAMRAASADWRWRRVAGRVVGVLVLGVVAAALSAWIAVGVYSWEGPRKHVAFAEFVSRPEGGIRSVLLTRNTSTACDMWTVLARHEYMAAIYEALSDDASANPFQVVESVEWPRRLPVPRDDPSESIVSEAWGWPWVSMHSVEVREFRPDVPDGGVQVSLRARGEWSFSAGSRTITLPLIPVWGGLARDAAVYSMGLGMLWWGPGQFQRFIRRRRGRCEGCGYSLLGYEDAKCPECGSKTHDSGLRD
jgi:hypothetical protein